MTVDSFAAAWPPDIEGNEELQYDAWMERSSRAFVAGIDRRLLKAEAKGAGFTKSLCALMLNPNVKFTEVLPTVYSMPEIADVCRQAREEILAHIPARPVPIVRRSRAGTRGEILPVEEDGLDTWERSRVPTASFLDGAGQVQRGSIVDYWAGLAAQLPSLSRYALRLASRPVSSAAIERVFSQARSCLDYTMAASRPETIDVRFFLHANRDFTIRTIDEHPELGLSPALLDRFDGEAEANRGG